MRVARSRFVTALLSGTMLMAVVAPASSAASATSESGTCPQRVEGEVGTWLRRPAPATPSGEDRITSHVVDPSDPTRHLVTDGRAILRTVDDGCTWEPTFELPAERTPELLASDATDRIIDLVAHPTAPGRVWAVIAVGQTVEDDLDYPAVLTPASREGRDLTGVVVLRSDDGGASWAPMAAPPIAPGAPIRLAPAPSDPDIAYLLLNGVPLVTEDGGETWLPRPTVLEAADRYDDPPQNAGFLDLSPIPFDLAVDPSDARTVFTRSRDNAYRSTDGGLTWSHLPPQITNAPSGPFVERFARHPDGLRALYVHQRLADAFPRAVHRYREDTGDLQELAVPEGERILGAPLDAVWHPDRDEVLLATWQNNIPSDRFDRVSLYLFDLSGPTDADSEARFVDVDELGLSPLRGVDVDRTGAYHVHNLEELVTLHTAGSPPGQDHDDAPRCDVGHNLPRLEPADPAPAEPADLRAPQHLQAGDERPASADVRLDLPAAPGPLDVYFLIDTSNGFRGDIGDVARGMADIVNVLADAGVDAQFGLGGLGTADTYRYRRIVDIGPAGEELREGLAGLCTRGGFESHLISLHQTATGSGVPGGEGRHRPEVPPGQDPTWREESLRTVVVVTDNEFDDRTPREDDPDRPERQEVYDALVAADLRTIGIEIVRDVVTPAPIEGQEGTPGYFAMVEAADAAGATAPTPAREDLEAIASVTGTLAPPGGVDCRGTGRAELSEGDPLVCTTFSTGLGRPVLGESTMGGVLERVLLAQQDLRTVSLRVDAPDGVDVEVTPETHEAVDVSVDHVGDDALPFTLSAACDVSQEGRQFDVDLLAQVGEEVVATASTVIACGAAAGGPGGGETDGDPDAAPFPEESASDPAPATGPPPASGGTPAPVPAGGQAPAPAPVGGQAPAASPATTPGQAQGTSQASTPSGASASAAGTSQAPATRAGEAGAPATTPAPGSALQAAGGPVAAVAAPAPEQQQRPQVAVATSPAGGPQLAFVAASSRSRPAPASALWFGAAAGGFALALALGSRRSAARLARLRG